MIVAMHGFTGLREFPATNSTGGRVIDPSKSYTSVGIALDVSARTPSRKYATIGVCVPLFSTKPRRMARQPVTPTHEPVTPDTSDLFC